jgi:hypothetical protein
MRDAMGIVFSLALVPTPAIMIRISWFTIPPIVYGLAAGIQMPPTITLMLHVEEEIVYTLV